MQDQLFSETGENLVLRKGCWLLQIKSKMRKRGPWFQKNYEKHFGGSKVES
jgi:hypothetical protein